MHAFGGGRGGAVRRAAVFGALIGAFFALAVWSRPAAGASAPRVALLTTDPANTTTKRLKAELTQLGVVTVVVRAGVDTPVGRIALENVARRVGAFAAIRVVPVESEVEVWVADRVTGKTVVREVLHGSDSASSTDDTIALGAVELLRASLLEVTSSYEPKRGEVPPPPVVVEKLTPAPTLPPPAPKPRPVLGVALEPAATLEFDGIRPGVSALLLVRYSWTKALGVEAMGVLPVVLGQVKQELQGTASVAMQAAGVGLTWSWHEGDATALLGLGMLASRLQVVGTARPNSGLDGVRDTLVLGAPYVRAGAGFAIMDSLRIRLDTSLSYALRRVPIEFVGDEVANWGRPSLVVGVGPEVLLP